MLRKVVHSDHAPAAIGTYSQAVRVDNMVYLSGQIALMPETMAIAEGGVEVQIEQVFRNLSAVAEASGGSLADTVKLTVYLTNLDHFPLVNQTMARYFDEPYPARAAIGVRALPKDALVEMDAILYLDK